MVTAMFFKDLSTCAYFARGVNVRAIGWLEGGHPYRQGEVSAEFLAVLKAQIAIAYQAVHFLGSHSCSLCPKGQQCTGFRNLLVPMDSIALNNSLERMHAKHGDHRSVQGRQTALMEKSQDAS